MQRNRRSERFEEPKKKKTIAGLTFYIILFAAVIAILVAITPKSPLRKASYTVASVDENGNTTYSLRSDYVGLRISEVMTSNSGAVPDYDGSYYDWVEIWNSTDKNINLKGVGLSKKSDRIQFTFPDVTLSADARIVVFCSGTNDQDITHGLHAKFTLSAASAQVYLFDPYAYIIDAVQTPVMNTNEAMILNADETYSLADYFTPGYENTQDGFAAYRANHTVESGAILINEVMASPKTGLKDENGNPVDWIELYNTTGQTILLDNYALSDKETTPLKWRFPQGAAIAPYGYYVVYCDGLDYVESTTGIAHTNFSISAEHEVLLLSDNHGRTMDRVVIDNLPSDKTYGRDASGAWREFTLGSPGMPNNTTGMWQFDQYIRSQNPTGVYITEVMASGPLVPPGSASLAVDWVELYNASTQPVYLDGYGLSDNIDRGRKWQFPSGTMIAPGSYLLVYCDGKATGTKSGELHTGFRIGKTKEEMIVLATPDGTVLDRLTLPADMRTDISYGRTNAGFRYFDQPTPVSANANGFLNYASAPEFSLRGGIYEGTVYVSISSPSPHAVITYTVDGSVPTQNSTVYRGETFEITGTTVLRARCFEDNLYCSTVTTATYLMNVYHALPVVCLCTDPDVLYNPQTGFLIDGPDIDKSTRPYSNTIYRKYGKINQPAYLEYYSLDNTQILGQGVEFRLYGDFSLDIPQKSMKVIAKSSQGSKYFDTKLFDDRDATRYKSFLLRNGGNDGVWTRFVDSMQSQLVDMLDTTVIHMASKPVVVYLNGVYWGHYNMREAKDSSIIAAYEGVEDKDDIIVLQGNMTAVHGSNKEYKAMISTIKTLSPGKNPEDLQYILDRVDVDNYFDWLAIEMFFGNSDIGNCRMYQVPGGKWRWFLYDLDYALFQSTFDSAASYTKEKGMGDKRIDNTIFRKLLENDEMKDLFLTKLGTVYKTFTTDVMLLKIDEMVQGIEGEMSMHFARWAEFNDKELNSDSPLTPDGAMRYWRTRISRLQNVVKKRPNLFWDMVRNTFGLTMEQTQYYLGPQPEMPAGVS